MFIVKNDDLIILAKETREELEQALLFMVYTDIEETDIEYELYNGEYLTKEEIKKQKREALDKLELTPADVERALYKAKKMNFDMLKEVIQKAIPTIDMIALNIEFNASTFFRGATFGEEETRLFDVIGALIDYTSEDMDYLFEHKQLPVKEVENEDTTNTENTTNIRDEAINGEENK